MLVWCLVFFFLPLPLPLTPSGGGEKPCNRSGGGGEKRRSGRRPPGGVPREDHRAPSAASHNASRTAPYGTSGMGLSLWPRISMIARCGCLRARAPRPDVPVALRMRGKRLCHSNRSVNGSNGNGGSRQGRRGHPGAWRGERWACGGGGRPSGCWGAEGLGKAEPGRLRDLGVTGGGPNDGACSGMGVGRAGRGWGVERRPLRSAPERSPRSGCGIAAARDGGSGSAGGPSPSRPGLRRAGVWRRAARTRHKLPRTRGLG